MRNLGGRRRAGQQSAAVTVTTAGRSHSDDLGARQRRYLALQLLRVVCLLLAATVPAGLLVRGALLVGAVVLPYFGVVMANAGPARERSRRPNLHSPEPPTTPRIGAAPRVIDADPAGEPARPAGVVSPSARPVPPA